MSTRRRRRRRARRGTLAHLRGGRSAHISNGDMNKTHRAGTDGQAVGQSGCCSSRTSTTKRRRAPCTSEADERQDLQSKRISKTMASGRTSTGPTASSCTSDAIKASVSGKDVEGGQREQAARTAKCRPAPPGERTVNKGHQGKHKAEDARYQHRERTHEVGS
ncbi:hypothetical protein PHLGIDRAFT_231811 [Phlebiopsis gigantea 11061_1 CR5-6]|uniref:Uncharacterized protein n=1 Tax=Phlebiopsis gigantea (strain 11061_1 CR5-6) TaxID=745531 RepID=A0A0C3S469_PHLG1|nr:hypothetical protein PHLGIDRAFT_231811 [Phlebiopsis gigantea 11061_1 CR5-6]